MRLTLKKEATKPAAANFLQQQARFDKFAEVFNHQRPHEALDVQCPAEVYQPSPYTGLPNLDYPLHDKTIVVTRCGRICLGKKKINFSQVFADRPSASKKGATTSGWSALWIGDSGASPKGTSVYPSLWRDTDCKSHFIIWRDDILLFGERYGESWIGEAEAGEQQLLQRVRQALTDHGQSAQEISDQIPDSEPWEVLRCCRRLCKLGEAIEGRHHGRGGFRRRE